MKLESEKLPINPNRSIAVKYIRQKVRLICGRATEMITDSASSPITKPPSRRLSGDVQRSGTQADWLNESPSASPKLRTNGHQRGFGLDVVEPRVPRMASANELVAPMAPADAHKA
jgi:hypothetical protein